MDCMEVSELLPQLLAGTLGRERDAAVLAHLAGCEACRKELAFWAKLADEVRTAAQEMPQANFERGRRALFGARELPGMGSLRMVRESLGLTGSLCRAAFRLAGASVR